MTIFQGINCTAFQGNINWRLVKESQIDFAMLRATMGCENKIQSHTDINFHRNMHDAAEAGIALGAYHCLLATTVEDAREESDCFLRAISGYEFSYPVAVDIEDRALRYLQKDKLDAVVQAWCNNIRNAGYYVMIRATLPTIQNRLSNLTMQQIDLWLIKYGETTDYSGDIGIWQYTGAGSVGGVQGRIGRLRALRNYPLIIQKTGDIDQENENNVAPKPPSSSAKSPVIQAFDTLYSLAELRESIRELFEDSDIKRLLSKEPQACKCEHKEQTQNQNFNATDTDENNESVSDEILRKHNSKQNEPTHSSKSLDTLADTSTNELPQTNLNSAQPDMSQDAQTLPENIDKTNGPKNEPSSDGGAIIRPESSSEPQQHDDKFENQLEQTETDEDVMSELLSLTAKTNISKIICPDEFEDDEEETEEQHHVRRPMRGRWKWLF